MYQLSKRVRPGRAVRYHGNKIVLCNNPNKMVGVYDDGFTIGMRDMNGERRRFEIPPGIRTWGPAFISVEVKHETSKKKRHL